MKKVLVTGAKGQLGHKIRQVLGDGSQESGNYANPPTPNYQLILTDSDNMDITDKLQVHKVIKLERPDFIIHGAAYTAVDKAEENVELCRKVNALGTKNIAECAKEFDVPVIYISTDYVFDGKKKSPYTETDPANPLSVYGATKFEGENFIREICDKYYIIRSAWIFGELPDGHPGTNFVETMIRLSKEKDSLNIVDDQIGSPTYTGDLVEIILRIIRSQDLGLRTQGLGLRASGLGFGNLPKSQILNPKSQVPYGLYHFSGTGKCSWYDFALAIFTQTKTNIDLKPITSDQYPQKAKRPVYSYLDKSKIENALNIKVRPWQEMLAEYVEKRK